MSNQYKKAVSTYVRNIYSMGYSYIMISYFNTNLSFYFAPFKSKDATGRSFYDSTKKLTTTVNYEGAFALYKTASDIVNGKEATNGAVLTIPCASGASLTLERNPGQNGQMETLFTIFKSYTSISFKFATHQTQVKENGQLVIKTIESGLGMFAKTIEGYLTGINADGHLNKFGDDLEKYQEEKQ